MDALASLLSPLFLQPFLTGLCFAVLLPLFGCYLRLRNEWLAAFAYAHIAAAGALLALAVELPLIAGGIGLATVAAVARRLLAGRLAGETAFALLLLSGWAATVLLTANLPMAERLGHALFDGQLYFTGTAQLALAAAALLVALPLLSLLSRQLLLAQLYPAFHSALQMPAWRIHLGFDLLAVGVLAAATMALGVMGTFALVFIPPWIAFAGAANWRRGLLMATAIGGGGYCGAFLLALQLDQPFGPILAMVLIAGGIPALLRSGGSLPSRRHR